MARKVSYTVGEDDAYNSVAELFGVLAESTRVKIVQLLLHHECSNTEIATSVGITRQATSQHLRLLRGLHLLTYRRAGRLTIFCIEDPDVAALLQIRLSYVGRRKTVLGDDPSPATSEAGSALPHGQERKPVWPQNSR